jgi:flagellar motor component MotA
MFAIIEIVVVFGCMIAGYLMEHGNLKVLMQPAELVIIGGAAAGTVLIANPLNTLKDIARGIMGVFGASAYSTKRYVELLTMIFELLNKARREGLVALGGRRRRSPKECPGFQVRQFSQGPSCGQFPLRHHANGDQRRHRGIRS